MSIETSIKENVARAQKFSAIQDSSDAVKKISGQPDLSGELNKFVKDIEELIKDATLLTGDELTQIKARLYARVAEAQESVEELGGEISEQARKGATATNEYVHQQPWTAIGAGAVAGLLLGFALARRS